MVLEQHEWVSFLQAAPGVQRPVLVQGLRDLRSGETLAPNPASDLRRNLYGYRAMLRAAVQEGPPAFADWRGARDCQRALDGVVDVVRRYEVDLEDPEPLNTAAATAQSLSNAAGQNGVFTQPDLDDAIRALDAALSALPSESPPAVGNEDAPVRFDVDQLADHLEFLAQSHPSFRDAARYLGSLTMRIGTLLGDGRVRDVVGPGADIDLEAWLSDFLGDEDGAITVVDLSLVPSDIVQVVTGVVARMLFEALQRHHRRTGEPLPTVLVLEEAHDFVARRTSREDATAAPHDHCVATFERIAREGRKFGCSLVVSSQRPAELSETVLAQCNTFLLHRLVNDRDQGLVRKLVPDALGGVLDELPALPARHAVLLGWASTLPVLLEIRELEEAFRPRSADPGYWAAWTSSEPPPADWPQIVEDWTAGTGGAS